jgi:hypothetical protein
MTFDRDDGNGVKAGGLGNLGNEQLEWLEDDLNGRPASTPIGQLMTRKITRDRVSALKRLDQRNRSCTRVRQRRGGRA